MRSCTVRLMAMKCVTRSAVRRSQSRSQPSSRSTSNALELAEAAAEVGFAHVPGVAHRREAVADVRHAGRRPGGLGDAMAEADDQVAWRQPPAGGERHQRQQIAIVARAHGASAAGKLVRGRASSMAGDTLPGLCRSVKSRASGQRRQSDFQALLAAAHAGQPVVNQRYTRSQGVSHRQ